MIRYTTKYQNRREDAMKEHHEKVEKLTKAVREAEHLTPEEKSMTLEKIAEWKLEDKAFSLLPNELAKLSEKVVPILEEIGLL
jgi:ABC-type nitrate/sulfonate/bicarbonate transport system substrate-binding protein